jgi:hypothetical protein
MLLPRCPRRAETHALLEDFGRVVRGFGLEGCHARLVGIDCLFASACLLVCLIERLSAGDDEVNEIRGKVENCPRFSNA